MSPLNPPVVDGAINPLMTTASVMGSKHKFGNGANFTSAAWPANGMAILVPFEVYGMMAVNEMWFMTGTTPGTANFDLGLYYEDWTRIVSLGATAATNTTDAILPANGGALSGAPILLSPGRYYMAMSAAATTITTRSQVPGNGVTRAFGHASMASAHPLPTTITPAAAQNYVPLIGMMTSATIL